MRGNETNDPILLVLGRIEGELKGIRDLVHSTSHATNARIDDLTVAVNKRIDDHQVATNVRMAALQKQIHRKGIAAGGASGAMASVVVEIIRATLHQ